MTTSPPSTPPTTAVQQYVADLRDLASWLETNPLAPQLVDNSLHSRLRLIAYAIDADEFGAMTHQLGGNRVKDVDDNYFRVTRRFGDHEVVVYARRDQVCEAVVVGSRTVEREVLPAEVKELIEELRAEHTTIETITEDEIEWRCTPVLSSAEQLEHVANARRTLHVARQGATA